MRKYFAMAAICGTLAMAGSGVYAAETLTPEDWFDWERAQDAQISPDGDDIIFTRLRVNAVSDRWDSELWMMTADGQKKRSLGEGGSARWSPEGDRIAFIKAVDGKPQLHVRWMDAEAAVSQITHGEKAPKRFVWAPDGQSIAFIAEVPLTPGFKIDMPAPPEGAKWTENATVIDRLHYRIDRQGMKTGYRHLFVVPAEGGTPRALTEGQWDVGAQFSGIIDTGTVPEWTPDGSHIIIDGHKYADGEEGDPFISHLYAVATDSGDMRQITQAEGFWASPAISPDGEMIAYTGFPRGPETYEPRQLRLINTDGTGDRVLIADLPDGASSLTWDEDGDGIYFVVNKEGARNVHYVDTDGDSRDITDGPQLLSLDSVSDDGTAAGIIVRDHTTANVVRFDLSDGDDLVQLTDLNADVLHGVELGAVEEVWYTSSDETRVQGWIIKPPSFDPEKEYPLILQIHGGPHGMYNVGFNFYRQAFAADGYVVLYTNPRGSTGYGQAFANAIDNAYPGRRDFDDLMAGVDTVIAEGYIDTSRMYVTGCSGGGVLTTWTVGHTDRFAAAAALCPVTEWIHFAGTTDVAAWAFKRFRPAFWEDPTPWLDHAPIMHVDKVTTPTLLMTGNLDLRTPLAQAESYYSMLKMLGVPTKLIVMKDEWHGTTSKPSNMLRTIKYLDKWFDMFQREGGDVVEVSAD